MKKRRTHTLKIRVTFDKACGPMHALRSTRDCIHGEFYPMQRDETEPGTFKVAAIVAAPARRRAR